MRKLLVWALVAVVLAEGALVILPNLRLAVQPYVPQAFQGWLGSPDKTAQDGASGAKTDASASGGQNKRRGDGGPIAVSVATAKETSFPIIERTYGIVQSPATIAVNARVASQITQVLVKDGQVVKAGDLLVTLDDRLLQAQLEKDQAGLLKDQVLADSANLDMQRAQELFNNKSGTQQAYEQALATLKSFQAAIAADQAAVDSDKVQLTFTKITAPIGGRLGAVQASVGNLVGSATSGTASNLMTITQMSPLKVLFSLPERNLTDIRNSLSAQASITVRAYKSATRELLDSGGLDFIDSAINTTSGTIAMSATLANIKLGLWPGQYVDVEIEHGVLANAVVVPTVAIQPGQAGSFVWVVKDGKSVEVRPVTVARADGENSAVSSGLQVGDQVVIEGQLKLKSGAAVSTGGDKASGQGAAPDASSQKKKKSP
jgi:membrane fusion protein, multidrug efflux system